MPTGNQGLPCFLWDGAAYGFLGRGALVFLGLWRCAGKEVCLGPSNRTRGG